MNYKKLTLFLLTVFIVLSTTSIISASDLANSTVNETIELDDTSLTDDEVSATSEDISSEEITDTVDEKTVKTEETHKTHIVNSTTVSEIFDFSTTNGYLSDIVSEGDTLDFQGTINLTNQSLTFNKAVNVTSTTGDSLICLNTVADTYSGENPGTSFIFNENGSYSNVSNINLYGTQLWVSGATQIVFDNISVVVNGSRVGSGVGVSAIRNGATYITLKNSYFYTKDNGGSTTIALSAANYCTVDNCTIQAEGNVGNLFYLNFYNINMDTTGWNCYNNITNNHLIGPATPLGICWGIVITGGENLIVNNTIDYGGTVITAASGSTGQLGSGNMIINNTVTNTSSTVSLLDNVTVTGNSFVGSVSVGANSVIENNTMASITSIGGNTTIIGNNITNKVTATTTSVAYANSSIINNTIMGDVTLSNNYTITGNNITGSVTLNQNSSTLDNNVIMGTLTVSSNNTTINGNNITGTITISSNVANNLLKNNTVNGSIFINGDDITVTGNNVTSNTSYTIEVMGDNAVISDNYLIATTTAGDNSVVISSGSGSVVENNMPTSSDSVIITDDNYSEYFYDNGTFMGNVANYTTITLKGQFNSKSFIFTNGTYTIIGDNTLIMSGVINVTSTAKVTILNVTINNTDSELTQAIILESSGNLIESNNIYYDRTNTFTAITITGNDNIITNNNIMLNASMGIVDVTTNLTTTYAIGILSSNNNVSSNTISIAGNDNDGTYSTVDGITIQSIGSSLADSNVVYNNTISINSTSNVYIVNIGASASNNNISNNTLNANVTKEVYGIGVSSTHAVNTTIYGNKINLTSQELAYGVVVGTQTTGEITANISFNQINATADQVYLIEVYDYAHDIIIGNNTLRGSGNYTMGIGIANSQDITITNNTISINGTTNGTTTSEDIISPTTAGIYIYNTTNVKINSTNPSTTSTTQKINVTNGVGVYILDSSNVTIYKVGILTNYSSNIQDALVIENSSNITVYNGSIRTTGYTITTQNSAYISIFNMSYYRIDTAGYNLTSQENEHAIKLVNTTNIEVYNNKIYATTTSGNSAVELINCTNALVYNNIPYESTIELDTTGLILGVESTVYINILTDIGETKANGTATITIEDQNYTATISNGVGSFTYTPTTNDPINITLNFTSDNQSITSNATLTTQIQIENYANLTIDQINTSSGSTITLRTNIIVNGIATSEGYITINVNGETLTDTKGNIIMVDVEDGIATYDYTLPVVSEDTTYNISIMYTGSVILESDITITVLAPTTASLMIETTGDLKPGSTVNFTATITDEKGNPVSSGRAVFKLNGKTLRDSEGNVIYAYVSNGIASIEYNIPDNYAAKDYVLTVVFAGSGFTRSEANTTITITKNNTKVTTSDITVTKGDNTKLTATITDDEGNPVTGTTKVVIKINNKTVMQDRVVNGVIDFTLFTDSFTNPTYTVTIIVGENSYYNKAEESLTLTVVE